MVLTNASRSRRALIVRAWGAILACVAIAATAVAADRRLIDNAWLQAAARRQPQAGASGTANQPPPIMVALGPGGVIIASEDIAALDQFERLLTITANDLASDNPGITVFYLKHAKAAVVAQTLEAVFAGRAPRITAEPRLNALIVQSDRTDADRIEELLKVLDQRQTPQEIFIPPKPRIIAVKNASAQDMAQIVRQVYVDRMTGGSARGAGQAMGMPQGPFQASFGVPQEAFEQLAALGGGMGGRGGGLRGSAEDVPRMSIGVNMRTNSLVVAAPDALFREVEDLVAQLDRAAAGSKETVQVLALHRRDAGLLAQALPAFMGDRVRVGQGALAFSSPRLPAVQAQGRFGQGPPFAGPESQFPAAFADPSLAGSPPSPLASQGIGPDPVGAPQGPFGSPGMGAGPAASFPAGPQSAPFAPQFPGMGPAPMPGPGPMMEPGQPAPAPGFTGGEGIGSGPGPGSPAGPGPGAP